MQIVPSEYTLYYAATRLAQDFRREKQKAAGNKPAGGAPGSVKKPADVEDVEVHVGSRTPAGEYMRTGHDAHFVFVVPAGSAPPQFGDRIRSVWQILERSTGSAVISTSARAGFLEIPLSRAAEKVYVVGEGRGAVERNAQLNRCDNVEFVDRVSDLGELAEITLLICDEPDLHADVIRRFRPAILASADIATVAELARSNEYFSIVRLPDPARSVSSPGPVLALTRKHSRLVEPGLFRKTSKKIGGVRLFEWAG